MEYTKQYLHLENMESNYESKNKMRLFKQKQWWKPRKEVLLYCGCGRDTD